MVGAGNAAGGVGRLKPYQRGLFSWELGEGKQALGRCPKPREGLCPLDPHQGWALDAIYWVRDEMGPTRMLKRHGWPPFFPDPTDRSPGAVPLVGSKGEALAGFGGYKPGT